MIDIAHRRVVVVQVRCAVMMDGQMDRHMQREKERKSYGEYTGSPRLARYYQRAVPFKRQLIGLGTWENGNNSGGICFACTGFMNSMIQG